MKSFFAAVAFLATAFAAPAALADTYVGVGVAQNQASVEGFDLSDGTALDVTVGTGAQLEGFDFRIEGSLARVTSETSLLGLNLSTESTELSGAVLYDLPVDWAVRPYVGVGANYTFNGEADVLFTTVDFEGFGYDLRAGFRAPITDRVTADVSVRQIEKDLELSAFGSSFDADVEETRLRVGFNVAL